MKNGWLSASEACKDPTCSGCGWWLQRRRCLGLQRVDLCNQARIPACVACSPLQPTVAGQTETHPPEHTHWYSSHCARLCHRPAAVAPPLRLSQLACFCFRFQHSLPYLSIFNLATHLLLLARLPEFLFCSFLQLKRSLPSSLPIAPFSCFPSFLLQLRRTL